MNVAHNHDHAVSRVAAAIGEPARARMLFCLIDRRARTSTELAMIANVTPSTASVHLNRLRSENLVKVSVQGKHRYYSLNGENVGNVLEKLSVLVGEQRPFVPNTPNALRAARTCYDHIAGTLGVSLHDRFKTMHWFLPAANNPDLYELTPTGVKEFEALGTDINAIRTFRRRFAFACLDWSERRAHLGGALGAALLNIVLKKRWATQELDDRALTITNLGRREMQDRFGLC
jgi:DNA-binding transcriptional ArsR family regulator